MFQGTARRPAGGVHPSRGRFWELRPNRWPGPACGIRREPWALGAGERHDLSEVSMTGLGAGGLRGGGGL